MYEAEKLDKSKIICECGCEILKKNIKQHYNTKKHLNYIPAG